MRVAVVHNSEEKSKQVAKRLTTLLEQNQIRTDSRQPEIVISVGGDGTFLSAFHRFSHLLDEVGFLGIHTGHLGFYTDWRDYKLKELVGSLCIHHEKSTSYPLLDVRIRFRDGKPDKYFLTLNESTIKRGNRTMMGDVFIRDELFERFCGDGLSISTPTGFTAYNKSIDGAVLRLSINAFQLTEIASLSNRVFQTSGSPIVTTHTEWLEIKLQEDGNYFVTVDRLDIYQKDIASVCYWITGERIHFASYRHIHFWHRVKDTFIDED